jgi:hypothetical protein
VKIEEIYGANLSITYQDPGCKINSRPLAPSHPLI